MTNSNCNLFKSGLQKLPRTYPVISKEWIWTCSACLDITHCVKFQMRWILPCWKATAQKNNFHKGQFDKLWLKLDWNWVLKSIQSLPYILDEKGNMTRSYLFSHNFWSINQNQVIEKPNERWDINLKILWRKDKLIIAFT